MWIDLKAVLRWLWPGDTLKFYENYFRACDLVVNPGAATHLAVIAKLYLIIAILLLKSGHLAFLGLFRMGVLGQLVHYNVFYFLLPEIAVQLNLALAIIGVACARYYYIFYFHVHPSLNEVLREVVVRENGHRFFLCFKGSGEEERVVLKMRHFAAKLLKYLRFFLLTADVFAVYSRLVVSYQLIKYRAQFFSTFFSGLFYMIINWTSALLFAIYLLYLLNICIMIVSVQMVSLKLYRIKVRQILELLGRLLKSGFNWLDFFTFRAVYSQTLVDVLQTNSVYRRTLILYFIVSWSLNAYLVGSFLLGFRNKSVQVYLLAFLALNQLLAIGFFNGLWAHFNTHLQRPAKGLYALAANQAHKMGNFKARLTLINYIFSFNFDHFYGYTYGSLGNRISGRGYVKCLFAYITLLSLAYNLFKYKYLYENR